MNSVDARWMRRCFDLAGAAVDGDELPFGSVIVRDGVEIAGAGNGVRGAGDITRHAEVCAIVSAQKALGRPCLDGCTLYTNIEPCAFCSYAIRESRIGRVVFALASPLMGGSSRWDVLQDAGLGGVLPEVFGPAPEVLGGFLADEADAQLREIAPMMWATSRSRRLFVCEEAGRVSRPSARRNGLLGTLRESAMAVLRRRLFDRFGRGVGVSAESS